MTVSKVTETEKLFYDRVRQFFFSEQFSITNSCSSLHCRILEQCIIIKDESMQFKVGVAFHRNNFILFFNPKLFKEEDFTPENIKFLIHHETEHIIRGHIFTDITMIKYQFIYNLATDAFINEDLKKSKITSPDSIYFKSIKELFNVDCEKEKIKNSTALYHRLLESISEKELDLMDLIERFNSGDIIFSPGFDSSEAKKLVESLGKKAGINPGEMGIELPESNNIIDILRFLRKTITSDVRRTYTKIYRRHVEPLIKKGKVYEGNFSVNAFIDTSGSMDLKDITTVVNTLERMPLNKLCVYPIDTQLYDPITKVEDLRIKMVGRGGTNFSEAYDLVNDKKQNKMLVNFLFTDGYVSPPSNSTRKKLKIILVGDYNKNFPHDMIYKDGKQR